jgi:1-acyl-sn-glycerol-3-phosphate acyltransferase
LLWGLVPPAIRYRTRPVAGADYWNATPVRRFLIHRVFRGVLVKRVRSELGQNPLAPLQAAIDAGDSLIFFPEGTRALADEMLPFKSGLYHLALANPALELVPVRMENLSRVMPKGELLPVPLVCILTFGAPVVLGADEVKADFLGRARQAILDMQPRH